MVFLGLSFLLLMFVFAIMALMAVGAMSNAGKEKEEAGRNETDDKREDDINQ